MAFGRSSAEKQLRAAGETATQGAERVLEVFNEMPSTAYVAAMAGAIAASMALMFLPRERAKHWALFVGLWAPTILNVGLYSRLRRS